MWLLWWHSRTHTHIHSRQTNVPHVAVTREHLEHPSYPCARARGKHLKRKASSRTHTHKYNWTAGTTATGGRSFNISCECNVNVNVSTRLCVWVKASARCNDDFHCSSNASPLNIQHCELQANGLCYRVATRYSNRNTIQKSVIY